MTMRVSGLLNVAVRDGYLEGLHSVVAVRRGRTLLEYYGAGEDYAWGRSLGMVTFGPRTLHDMRSITKSVTALAYGIALDAGRVPHPAAPLVRQFPHCADLTADPGRAQLTVEHALTMSLGLQWHEDAAGNSPATIRTATRRPIDRSRCVQEQPILQPPGTQWTYCGGATALLGQLIADGTGQSIAQYARETLFTPLGIDRFEWMDGWDGVPSAASGLRLTPNDLAKIGTLVLTHGQWDGSQVVPADWIRTMIRPRLQTDWGAGYGYQWYLTTIAGHQAPAAMGNGGQRLIVLPDLDLVVAITAGNYYKPDQSRTPRTVVEKVLLPTLT